MRAGPWICPVLWLACAAGPCLSAETEPASSLAELVRLAREVCTSEFDDPSQPEYEACTRAIGALEAHLAADPENSEVLAALVEALGGRDPEQAREYAHRLTRQAPDDAGANLLLAAGEVSPALRAGYLERAARSAPENSWVHGELAVALLETGRVEPALEEIKRQLAVNPDHLGAVKRFLAEAEERGLRAEAEQVLLAFLAADLPREQRCRHLVDLAGDRLTAPGALRSAFDETCGGDGYFELALRTAAPEERVALLREAVERSPGHLDAHGELALALAEQGDIPPALAEMRRQMALNPGAAGRMLPELLEGLRGRGAEDEEADLLSSFLRSAASREAKCLLLARVGVERFRASGDLWRMIEQACGEAPDPGNSH